MNPWVVELSHFLHIPGTVLWVGGILMVLLVILPSARAAIEETPIHWKTSEFIARLQVEVVVPVNGLIFPVFHTV